VQVVGVGWSCSAGPFDGEARGAGRRQDWSTGELGCRDDMTSEEGGEE
jgi:hypothetical protein